MRCLVLIILLPVFCSAQSGQALNSLLVKLPGMQEDTNRVKLLDTISSAYSGINPDEGMRYADQTMALARKLNWRIGEGYAYNDFGNYYNGKGDHPAALDNLFKALSIAEETGNKWLTGSVLNNIGNTYDQKKDYPKAEEYYFKSLKIAEKMGDKKGMMTVLGNFGILYKNHTKYKEALAYYRRALNMAEDLGDKASVIINSGNIGDLYRDQKDYSSALVYGNKALRIAYEMGDRQGIAVNLGNMGETFLAIAKNGTYPKSDSLVSATKRGNLAKAIEYLAKGIAGCREIHINQAVVEFSGALSEAYALQGNYKSALETYKQYTDVRDSLNNTENKEKIIKLETKRAIELKDKNILIAKLDIAKKRNERWFFIAGIVLLLLSMVIVIKNIQRRKLHEKQAAQLKTMIDTQESERKRISRDLHDDVGTKLSALGLFLSSMKEKAAASSPEISLLVQNSEQFIKEAVSDLRQLLLDLSPSILEEFGYTTAIEGLVNKINQTKLIHFNLIIFGMKERLEKDYELALYRITQELINNVLKHASAKNVSLQIGRREDVIVLMIEDDGVGFELAKHSQGYGLKSLTARAALMHGIMTIDTAPGRGTSVLIEIPFKHGIKDERISKAAAFIDS